MEQEQQRQARSIDEDLRVYHGLQAWLAGKKPPAQGRTWRRALQAVVPHAVASPSRALADTMAAGTLLRLAAPLAVLWFPLESVFVLPSDGGEITVRFFEQAIVTMIHVIRPVAATIGSLLLCCAAISFLFQEE